MLYIFKKIIVKLGKCLKLAETEFGFTKSFYSGKIKIDIRLKVV